MHSRFAGPSRNEIGLGAETSFLLFPGKESLVTTTLDLELFEQKSRGLVEAYEEIAALWP